MFKERTSIEGQSVEEIFNKDYKCFEIEGQTIGVVQVFTMDIEQVFARKEKFLEYMKMTHDNKNHFLTLLLITDILKKGSYLLYQYNLLNFVSMVFGVDNQQGVFIKGIVSRKK
ncbi:DHHA2 domain-containing protein [Garciella nitratireducens]|uniref:DHHA2 domain-containing protein n=1 Tax=Garciella nitratireducens DSM 15102 TaxID=1121911 RepID=A0A1T4KN26_9FIRM|nr:DHHA2 domain-containing protein [Garciella nitratireducens]SJZ43800.1 DHHA2 domain-containing protein [Garciella nitratireducens DSM 15102]